MARASRKRMGVGSQGKGSAVGANTEIEKDRIAENEVLSNRDKAQHPKSRGLDTKDIETEQYQDHEANRLPEE
ncbi:MAG: hypothetical protein R3D62_02220 [Xanthobacteraceae bacterium]